MTTHTPTDRLWWSVFTIFLRLGLTSFGGPIAHLAYFRDTFVTQRQWLSERDYADLSPTMPTALRAEHYKA